MSLPRISQGIGALTPEVWDQMMEAIRLSGAGQPGTTQQKKIRERDPFEQHWSLCGSFLARITGYAEIPVPDDDPLGGGHRWTYTWEHFVPFVNNENFFAPEHQPEEPDDHHTLDGDIPQPFRGLTGAASSKTHIVGHVEDGDTPTPYPCAYNLAEWFNLEYWANGVDMTGADWPADFSPQPIKPRPLVGTLPTCETLVVMHWTRYCFAEEEDKSSRVLFFFDRQNHFEGPCS